MNTLKDNLSSAASQTEDARDGAAPERLPYEAPRVLKKRSVAQVTLGTGMGQTAQPAQPPVLSP